MALGDFLLIGFFLIYVLGWILVAWDKYTDKCVRYDVFVETCDGTVMQITADQKQNSFYVIDGILCYFDERHIKMYLPLEPDCKVFYHKRKIKRRKREI